LPVANRGERVEMLPMQSHRFLAGSLLIAAGSGVCLLAEADSAQPVPWPHESSDVAVDPAVLFGALGNGMRFAVLKNDEPPGRVSLRLHIDAGSLHEADDQRGLAHFLEHMVFNGSRHFPNVEELIPKMQRLGIAFGAHANAYTSFDETVYMLDLPNLEADTLELALTVMRDFADGALLEAEEIEKERGVILAEKRARDSVERRLMEKQFEFLIPDSLIAHRFPIGIEEVIKDAPRERFVDYYSRYYIPRRMTFLAVGDIDPAGFEKRIRGNFGSMKNPEKPGPPPELGTIRSGYGFQAAVFADKEVKEDELALVKVRRYTREPDTVANRLKRIPLKIAHAIMGRRFDILAKKEGAPISGGTAGRYVWFNELEFGSIDVTPEEGRWREAVAVLEQETRRALEYGFSEGELQEMKAQMLNKAEQEANRAPTRRSPEIAMEMVRSIGDERVITHPREALRIKRKGLESLTTGEVHQAFRTFWRDRDLSLILTTREAPGKADEELDGLFKTSRSEPVAPPGKKEALTFAYTGFGAPGEVTMKRRVEGLDFVQLALDNNVRVNLKQTPFEKDTIHVLARFGNGRLTQPNDQTGLDIFARVIVNAGGLGKHSADDLRRILAGRNVEAAFGIEEGAFTLGGKTTPKDLELQLQLMCAHLADPGFRPEAVRQFRKMVPSIAQQLRFTIEGAQAGVREWARGGDGRFAKPDAGALLGYDAEDVRSWLKPELEESYLELSLVGDFPPESAIPLIRKSFGALPVRLGSKPPLTAERQLNLPGLPAEKQFTYTSSIEKAEAMVSWRLPRAGKKINDTRRLNLLGSILDDRLREKLREELGATYSPQTYVHQSFEFEIGSLVARSLGKPAEAESVSRLILDMGRELAGQGATADELERARKPVLSQLEASLRDNRYWLETVMAQSQQEPWRLDWARERDEDYAAATLEEINALAGKYLRPKNAARITIVPKAPPE